MKHKGYVIYEGPSMIDGAPIAVIATLKSRNEKTGDMVQTWIIRADQAPTEAIKSGADASICGDCKHRPGLGGACYVDVSKAPSQVFKAYKRGSYPVLHPADVAHVIAGRNVRLGAYGDPAAVPADVWRYFLKRAKGWTGYTHQWRTAVHLQDLCMASADSESEKRDANAMGWRTFRVRSADESLAEREIACPASDEAGNKTQCDRCKLCAGAAVKAKDIAIVVHGVRARRFIALQKA